MTIVRCIQYHLQTFRDVCNDSASDGGPVLIKVRIVPRIARSEEQTDHTYREDRGNRGDEPHRMLWQAHEHEKSGGHGRWASHMITKKAMADSAISTQLTTRNHWRVECGALNIFGFV